MLHVFNQAMTLGGRPAEEPDLTDALEAYFRLRHKVFVEERGWNALRRPDGREIDDFDGVSTIYTLWIEGNEVLAGNRFVPTTGPHLLNTIFPHYVTGPIPQDPSIMEGSRILVAPDARERSRMMFGKLMVGIAEASLALGMTGMTYVMDMSLLTSSFPMGWEAQMIGPPTITDEGDTVVAAFTPVTVELPRRLRKRLGLTDPLLHMGTLDAFQSWQARAA